MRQLCAQTVHSCRSGGARRPHPYPPHKGEGVATASESPSPLWGGVRGGGASRQGIDGAI